MILYILLFTLFIIVLRECLRRGWWRSADRTVILWPWKSPTTRSQCSSTRDTCSGCGMWMAGDIWTCLLVWLPSVWATATRKVLVAHNNALSRFVRKITERSDPQPQESDCCRRAAAEETVAHHQHLCLPSSPWVLWEISLLFPWPPEGNLEAFLLFKHCLTRIEVIEMCWLNSLFFSCTGDIPDQQWLGSQWPGYANGSATHRQLWHHYFQVKLCLQKNVLIVVTVNIVYFFIHTYTLNSIHTFFQNSMYCNVP